MTPTTTPEAEEAQRLLDQALKLSPRTREQLGRRLIESANPPPNSYPDSASVRAEIVRVIEAVENGTMKTYTLEETLDHIQKVLDEEPAP